jgi:hypothetical protein
MKILKILAWICAAFLAIEFSIVGYDSLDTNGTFPHRQTVDIYMSGDWLVGENRRCTFDEEVAENGQPSGRVAGVFCAMGDSSTEPHNVRVIFWGRINPYDMDGHIVAVRREWVCTRGSDGFTCKYPEKSD